MQDGGFYASVSVNFVSKNAKVQVLSKVSLVDKTTNSLELLVMLNKTTLMLFSADSIGPVRRFVGANLLKLTMSDVVSKE